MNILVLEGVGCLNFDEAANLLIMYMTANDA